LQEQPKSRELQSGEAQLTWNRSTNIEKKKSTITKRILNIRKVIHSGPLVCKRGVAGPHDDVIASLLPRKVELLQLGGQCRRTHEHESPCHIRMLSLRNGFQSLIGLKG